jgi:asparagine synthase (glutamine-hydrolysing)
MCGIIGYLSSINPISKNHFNEMRDSMSHRGPDGRGSEFFEDLKLALGHRRLSIVDLSEAGLQPMRSGKVWITFNGEIYNFKKLKEELKIDFEFNSDTDTEVILNGYRKWGIQTLLEKLEGMFAFAIYDEESGKMFVCRDRTGIKPLFYYQNDGDFIFASELKGIVNYSGFEKKISKEGVYSYFRLRYILGPTTIYENCYKLLPGSFIEYDCKNYSYKVEKYWELKSGYPYADLTEEEAISRFDTLLTNSIGSHTLTADVPVHSFLSGGIDSSLVTALVAKVSPNLSAYSIEVGNPDQNEIEDAKHASEYIGVPIITDKIDKKKFDEIHSDVIHAYDEPLADSSCVPTYFLSKLTSKYVKVSLSGDGGDELFYGYKWYNQNSKEEQSFEGYISSMSNTFSKNEISRLFGEDYGNFDFESRFKKTVGLQKINEDNYHIYDFHSFLVDDILMKVDIAGMAHSLETRIPFLDGKLVDFAFSIDPKLHFKNNELKYLLKKVGEKYLSNQTLYKEKKGFSVPSVNWLSCNWEHNLFNGYLSKDGVWNKGYVKELLDSRKLHQNQKWLLYSFERWYSFQFHNVKEPIKYRFIDRVKNKITRALNK